MSEQPFRFKQFSVAQDQCAMKVGTDGVLLGAWSNVFNAKNILDIGTGSGVIALMAAQRNPNASITAIEIEGNAAAQAKVNFEHSPWVERLKIIHIGLEEFAISTDAKGMFDSIICNPPYYPITHFTSAAGSDRQSARNDIHLTLESLVKVSAYLLSPSGSFNLIVPVYELERIEADTRQHQLNCKRRTRLYPNKVKPCHRILLEYTNIQTDMKESDLIIQQSGVRNDFTDEYISLTKDFYTIL